MFRDRISLVAKTALVFLNNKLLFLLLFTLLGLCFVRYLYLRFFTLGSIPDSFPWVGVRGDGFFSRARATWLSITKTREFLEEGYYKVRVSQFDSPSTSF